MPVNTHGIPRCHEISQLSMVIIYRNLSPQNFHLTERTHERTYRKHTATAPSYDSSKADRKRTDTKKPDAKLHPAMAVEIGRAHV